MKSPKDIRHKSRMKLVEELYVKRVNPHSQSLSNDIYKYDEDLYSKILKSIDKHTEKVNSQILKIARRNEEDIKNIEYVILEIALCEAYFEDITPYKVVIDESIELAREYGDESSAIFVSGVLGAAFENRKEK